MDGEAGWWTTSGNIGLPPPLARVMGMGRQQQHDLVIMAPTMEQLGRRVADSRASLLGKGLKVNAGKSKVVVGSSDGKKIVYSGKWPCGVCGKGVQANSVQCTVCKKWIHKRCSGVRDDLSRVADGFRCRQCDGTIQEVDLVEDLMVDGETYECVKSFCYLGATLDGDGGADLAATARIKWMDEVPRAFDISDIQISPIGDERSSVCQLCQKQHDLWK